MKMSFLISMTSDQVPCTQATSVSSTHSWYLGAGGLLAVGTPGPGSVHRLGFEPHPNPAGGVGDASLGLHGQERLEACLVLPGYLILFDMVCAYQRTVSVHFGG